MQAVGLAIHGAGSPVIKTTTDALFKIDGEVYTPLVAGDLPALTGLDVADGHTAVILVQTDKAGTVTYKKSDLGAIVTPNVLSTSDFPNADKLNAVVGYVVIVNGTGADFIGGTTDLDVGSLTVYYIDGNSFIGA